MKIKVDRDLCLGLGNCVALAPTVFALDKENKVVVLHYKSVDERTVMEAAESCPYGAIIIEGDDGHQQYP